MPAEFAEDDDQHVIAQAALFQIGNQRANALIHHRQRMAIRFKNMLRRPAAMIPRADLQCDDAHARFEEPPREDEGLRIPVVQDFLIGLVRVLAPPYFSKVDMTKRRMSQAGIMRLLIFKRIGAQLVQADIRRDSVPLVCQPTDDRPKRRSLAR